jgi:hypothetical protein
MATSNSIGISEKKREQGKWGKMIAKERKKWGLLSLIADLSWPG